MEAWWQTINWTAIDVRYRVCVQLTGKAPKLGPNHAAAAPHAVLKKKTIMIRLRRAQHATNSGIMIAAVAFGPIVDMD